MHVGKVLMVALVLLLPQLGHAAALADVIAGLRDSVVGIGAVRPHQAPQGKPIPSQFFGTGFVTGDGSQVVTNFHVIPKDLDADAGEMLVIFTGRGEQMGVRKVTVEKSDEEHDLAVLRVLGPALPAMKLAPDAHLREGEPIAFTGFPVGVVFGLYHVTHRGIVAAVSPMAIPASSARNLTSAQIRRRRKPFKIYQLDATAYPGQSGSPLFEPSSGEVVGVINSVMVKGSKEAALSNPTGITYAIPVRYVRSLLEK